MGIFVKVDAVQRLLEEVTAVRVALSDISEPVAAIGEQVTQLGEEKSEPDQVGPMIRLSARLIATFGSIGTRLKSFSRMLTEADTAVRTAGTTVRSWIRLRGGGGHAARLLDGSRPRLADLSRHERLATEPDAGESRRKSSDAVPGRNDRELVPVPHTIFLIQCRRFGTRRILEPRRIFCGLGPSWKSSMRSWDKFPRDWRSRTGQNGRVMIRASMQIGDEQ